ncbi:hypothetical protein JAAARDRAFT_497476 [Jaapia argillacea MUCL 33604]|uniref:F-box domain-containing protein n=1 Tax=Jaapia argillacea MUCL 33604 TaxID=933084 RepID=A0A067P9Z0_9AGAM|nr:hypothetical protein JAAARDRAFT_497476 [Jaapia argillacea MUCL 33604]
MNPSLRTLHISSNWHILQIDDDDDELEEFLRSLPRRCSALRSLLLGGTIPQVSLEHLSNLQQLTCLNLSYVYRVPSPFNSTTATALSTLPSLTDLRIPDVFIEYLGDLISTDGFLTLESLHIKGGDPPGIARTLRCISSPVLHEVYLWDVNRATGRDPVEHLWAFLKFSESLTKLQWCAEEWKDGFEESDFTCVGIELLEPLLVLKNLENLEVLSDSLADCPDSTISCEDSRRIAQAWPNMKNLSLYSSLFPFTLRSLITSVDNLETLETLSIEEVHNDNLAPSSDRLVMFQDACESHGPCNTKYLSELLIANIQDRWSDCDDLFLAVYLHTVFPNVCDITCSERPTVSKLISIRRSGSPVDDI